MRDMSNKSAKARMGASVRRGVDPKKGGQWITGTWDGGTWSAMVFSEPSEAYGIPEFPHISKLAINPKDKPGIGGVIVNYDRGWDIKPSTPELQKAYREIAQAATAEVKKAVKQGWYARTGSKAKMAMTPIRVTEAEYAALAARDAVSRKILGDSQYQITPSDRAIRASGDVAYKTALARHNAWDKAWRDAPNDAARAEVEARAKAAEAGMRVYRGSRPGAKAKFGIWGDAPDKYRAAIDFIQQQRTPSSAAMNDLKKAIKRRQLEAKQQRKPDMKQRYEDDAGSLQNILEYAQRGDDSTFLRSAFNLDTAVRDDIPIEMFIWAGADVNWDHPRAKSLLNTVSSLVARSKHGKSMMAFDSKYNVGDRVVARVNAQGMKKGQVYTVTDIEQQVTPWGTFVDYKLDNKMWVGNGHLVLDKATASRPGAKAEMAAPRLYVLAYEGRTPHRIPVKSISEGVEILKQNPNAAASLIHESETNKRTTIAYGTKTGRANWTDAGIEVARAMKANASRPGAKAKFAEQTAKRIGAWGPSNNQWIIDEITKHIIPIDNYGTGRGGRTEKSFRVTNKANGRVVRVLDAKSRSEAEGIVQDWLGDEHFARPGAKVTAGRAEDLYRQLSSGSITYANAKEWERLVTEALRLPDYTPPGGDMSLHEIAEDLGGDLMALKTHSGPVPHAKAKAEKATMSAQQTVAMNVDRAEQAIARGDRESARRHIKAAQDAVDPSVTAAGLLKRLEQLAQRYKMEKPSDLEREDVKAGLKLMEKADKAVSDKIRTLIAEGKPQDQAVAIALDMKRRGEI